MSWTLVVALAVAEVGGAAPRVGPAELAIAGRQATRRGEPSVAESRAVLITAAVVAGRTVTRAAALEREERRVGRHAVDGAKRWVAVVPAAALAHGAASRRATRHPSASGSFRSGVGGGSVDGRRLSSCLCGVRQTWRSVHLRKRCAADRAHRKHRTDEEGGTSGRATYHGKRTHRSARRRAEPLLPLSTRSSRMLINGGGGTDERSGLIERIAARGDTPRSSIRGPARELRCPSKAPRECRDLEVERRRDIAPRTRVAVHHVGARRDRARQGRRSGRPRAARVGQLRVLRLRRVGAVRRHDVRRLLDSYVNVSVSVGCVRPSPPPRGEEAVGVERQRLVLGRLDP